MTTATINVRMDAATKKEAEQLFQSLGLNMSTAVNIFVKQSLRERRIPFVVGELPPNAETISAIEEGHKLMADASTPRFHTISALREALEV
ncbi:TPA: type II toxin-antitoxin system RelB/DinJ family antitoxin [Streptococcus suis]|nr:type II toxin-antitoxin system RelB/DinJ family antitoxin [Streptococcus suis]HEM3648283.1 type II toxin-antitoxin system RelB/DinJ family antitoxin [Streptococcus suis]